MTSLDDSPFGVLRHKLLLDIDALFGAEFADSNERTLADGMCNRLRKAKSMETLRVLEKLMLKQKNAYGLYLMDEAIAAVTDFHDGPIDNIITEDHIARNSGFSFALQEIGGNPLPMEANSLDYQLYLKAMRYAAINCDPDDYQYLINNITAVGNIMLERRIRGPKSIIAILSVMRGSVPSLSSGSL